jgi:hypothetical protein
MRGKLALATVLAALVGGSLVTSVAAGPPARPSTPRPWGTGSAPTRAAVEKAVPKGATRLHETFLPSGEFRFAFTLFL